MRYAYRCPNCGPLELEDIRQTSVSCRCGRIARREWSVQVRTEGETARWDPVVGEYVRNNREFMEAVKRGKEAQEQRLGTEVSWHAVDARDHEGICELHGMTMDDRAADLEPTLKAERDKAGV
jgi:hypothetical protein